MKRILIGILAGLVTVPCMAQFNNISGIDARGKTDVRKMAAAIDVNFAAIEGGAIPITDNELVITFGTITNILGSVILDTSSLIATQADDDYYRWVGRALDTATNDTEYAEIHFVVTDNTTATENGQIVMQTTADGTLVTGLTIGHSAGGVHAATIAPNLTLTLDLDIDGGDITAPADLTITAAGADVLIDSGLTVGSTTQAGDNNLRVEGTQTQVGVATFTAQAVFSGGAQLDEDVAVNFDANDEEILVTITNTSANPFRIYNTDANPVTSAMMTLDLEADGDADAEFIRCRDNSSADTQFLVDAGGAMTVAGTATFSGTIDANAAASFTNVTLVAGALFDNGENVATNIGALYADSLAPDGAALTLNTGTGEATVDGKYAVVGPDASTGQMSLGASITATGTTMTNTFATVFGGVPIVTMTYTESATTVLYLGTITTSNFISFHESSKNYAYRAEGARP